MHSFDDDADGAATAILAGHPVPLINADISRRTDPNQNSRDEQTEFSLAAYCLTFSDKVLVTKCTYLVVINAPTINSRQPSLCGSGSALFGIRC